MYAHYTNPSVHTENSPTVRISSDIQGRDVLKVVRVAGRRDARKVAQQHGAQPWNF